VVRTILTWRILGEDLVGTLHVPPTGRARGLACTPTVGILLLNSGSTMRSGNSDLSVRIGDRLALRGFQVFRFDLAGLGDSSGPTPASLDSFWSEVVQGRHDEATVALIERIQVECNVAQVIVGGLCAAALPSVRAITHAHSALAGLILLEPNFRLASGADTGARQVRRNGPVAKSTAALHRIRFALGLHADSRLVRATRPLRAWLSGRFGHGLPKDANIPLLQIWQASFARKLPSLIVVAAEQGTDRYMRRILACVPGRGAGMVTYASVPGTNHLFTGGSGGEAVIAALERWVIENCVGKRESIARRADLTTAQWSVH
jgi:alpha-beta hydrolase superfamily lysophospholipase